MTTPLEEAIAHIEAGRKEAGKKRLLELLHTNPNNDKAWYWMAAVVDTTELRQECLEEALKHNPENLAARKALERLKIPPKPEAAAPKPKSAAPNTNQIVVITPFWIGVSMVISLLLMIMPLFILPNQIRLNREGVAVEAQVTNSQVLTGRRGVLNHQVQYQFFVVERDAWYTAGGWADLGEAEWNAATTTGRLMVVYLPSDPQVNRPASKNNYVGLLLTIMGIGLLMMLGSLWGALKPESRVMTVKRW